MNNALVRADVAIATTTEPDFDLSSLRVFTSVPDHRDFGIAALNGMVVVYDEGALRREGVHAGGFYVRESQRPRSGMAWTSWLEREQEDRQRRCGPSGPLEIRREVVMAVRRPGENGWAVRMASGHIDGPFYDWAFGTDFIGKVVGLYLPSTSKAE